jgi:hypothetical protein
LDQPRAIESGGSHYYALFPGLPTPSIDNGRLLVYPPTFHPASTHAAAGTTVTLASGEERGGVDLQIRPVATARVSGKLMGPDGPRRRDMVLLVPAYADSFEGQPAVLAALTDNRGAFAFPAVPAGEYSMRAANQPGPVGYERGETMGETLWAEMPVTVESGDLGDLVLLLQPGLRIHGRVEFEGRTPPPTGARLNAEIEIEGADPNPVVPIPHSPARLDAGGRFTTVGLAAGKYFLRATGSPIGWMFKSATYNGMDVSETPFELRGDDADGVVLTFTDRWTSLGGMVQDARGQGRPDATVLLFTTNPAGWSGYGSSPRRLRSARAARGGEYSIGSVAPGEYYVVAIPEEAAADWQDPASLERLARVADVITIAEGEHRTMNVRTREVTR